MLQQQQAGRQSRTFPRSAVFSPCDAVWRCVNVQFCLRVCVSSLLLLTRNELSIVPVEYCRSSLQCRKNRLARLELHSNYVQLYFQWFRYIGVAHTGTVGSPPLYMRTSMPGILAIAELKKRTHTRAPRITVKQQAATDAAE